jgi:hypothetical protein
MLECQQGAVLHPTDPAAFAAGGDLVSFQELIDIHDAGFPSPGEEEARGLYARAAGEELSEDAGAEIPEAVEEVASLLQILMKADLREQFQDGPFGN